MTASENSWLQAFPYKGGEALVGRLSSGWRLWLGAEEMEARTLVQAFETLTGRPASGDELRVVLAALAWDNAFGRQAAAEQGLGDPLSADQDSDLSREDELPA